MSFITDPNLPESPVCEAMLGKRYYGILSEGLKRLGIAVFQVPDNNSVDPRLAGHADMSAVHLGGRRILISAAVISLKPELEKAGYDVTVSGLEQRPDYPNDIGLNGCISGSSIICMEKALDKAMTKGRKIINVKQGYAKCSVCVLDKNHLITDDPGIKAASEKNGMNCLYVRKGGIILEGFDHGFIGGSCFKTDKKTIAFTGTLEKHPDGNKITDHIEKLGMSCVFLTR
ncbi:MAG: hypothetical protein J5827_00525, partial [Oscillospiraceae bacterium]|nr:hypothetical protein [Oscillospiraceae bacterium]